MEVCFLEFWLGWRVGGGLSVVLDFFGLPVIPGLLRD